MASTISAGTTTTTALSYSADTSGVLQLQTNGGTTALILDTSQNAGFGVTPSGWTGGPATQFKYGGSVWNNSDSSFHISENAFYNGSWNYISGTSASATNYYQAAGTHNWRYVGAGTGAISSWTTAMTLDVSGRLVIGSTTANAKLNVNTTTYSAVTNGEQVLIEGTSAWTQGLAFSPWSSGVYNSGYASGYIGVPNTPNQLYISGGAVVVNNTISSNWAKALNTTSASFMVIGSGATYFYGDTGLTANTAYTPTQRMELDSSGNLLVGTTNTAPGSGNTVTGCALNGSLGIGYFSRSNDSSLIINTNADGKICRIYRSGTECGSIQVTTTTTNYVSGSDYRLKTVIGAISDSGSRIDALEPIEYTWNSTGLRTRGFLAHKFQEVYENSVFGTKDAVDENGNPEYQSMEASSAEVIADLVAEIQSIRKRLAAANI